MEHINKFSSYISNVENISLKLHEFANRTSDISRVIDSIDDTLSESRNLMRFLYSHFDKIENSGNAALKSVGIAESHFEEAINSLHDRTEEMIKKLYASAGNHEAKLEAIYKDIETNLDKITTEYINTFREAYADAIPKNNELDKLDTISHSLHQLQKNKEILSKMDEVNSNLKGIKNSSKLTHNKDSNIRTEPSIKKPLKIGDVLKDIFS